MGNDGVSRRLGLLWATGLGVGYVPVAPGTAGSLLGLPAAWALSWLGGGWAVVAGAVIATVLGLWSAQVAEAAFPIHDSPHIVADELAGQILSLVVVPCTWPNLLVAFGWFRLFDTVKPFPAGWIDRHVDGATGVMFDDVVAGLYAALATGLMFHLGVTDMAVTQIARLAGQ